MSTATLLVYPDNAATAWQNVWSWDHMMAHRELWAVMGPLTQWSVLPYFIDPMQFNAVAADNWSLDHQQAHNDFTIFLPAHYDSAQAGMTVSQNLVDTTLSDVNARTWWTFANHQEHYLANEAVLPLPNLATNPWWATGVRRVTTFW